AMVALAEATGIPVATLQYDPDAFPSDHALALGMLGRNGWSSANRAAPQADVLVAIGAHIDIYSSTFRYGVFSQSAKLIHHSSAAQDIGAVYPVAQGVVGSTASFVEGLATRLKKRAPQWLDVAELRAD